MAGNQANKDSGEFGGASYQVIARKYRPKDFSSLIGQDAMVRTLTHAFASGRLAHAYLLAGIRGVGKTTTARIIAKALNCVGNDGKGEPTIEPCGLCDPCVSIAQERHVDVLEMDAASRTGVDDIRELIDGIRYKPISARYKIYIIDEVHMLSRNAFNALLKTLEEPPAHVKFIFATTEVRKIPLTVLSRCQRFDLRRVSVDALSDHFSQIAEVENARITEDGIALIARVSDGSVRDGQSLLDQAITNSIRGDKEIDENAMREILGLVDRERTFDLLEQVLSGEVEKALDSLNRDYRDGADPLLMAQDLLEAVHWLTRIKVSPAILQDKINSESEKVRGEALSESLSMATLSRAWQMLLKGLREIQTTPTPIQALEMVLVRLAFLTDLPSPADVVRTLEKKNSSFESMTDGSGKTNVASVNMTPPGTTRTTNLAHDLELQPGENRESNPTLESLDDLIALLDLSNERILKTELTNNVELVSFEPGKIEIQPNENALGDIPQRLHRFLNKAMTERWIVSLATGGGKRTAMEQQEKIISKFRADVRQHPLMRSVMEHFPGAEIETIRTIDSMEDIPKELEEPEGD